MSADDGIYECFVIVWIVFRVDTRGIVLIFRMTLSCCASSTVAMAFRLAALLHSPIAILRYRACLR